MNDIAPEELALPHTRASQLELYFRRESAHKTEFCLPDNPPDAELTAADKPADFAAARTLLPPTWQDRKSAVDAANNNA